MITIEFLPPEILSIVLEQACRDSFPNTEQAAQTLGWVSKLWRTIVFSTPSIWTAFYVGDRRQTKHIHNAMGRSGDLPLDVHIVNESSKIGAIREQLSDLANTADRWRTLQISHPDAVLILEQLSPLELPGIQTLNVKATARPYTIPLQDYYPFVPDYPSPPTFSLSWSSLQLPRLQDLEFNDIILEPKAVFEFLDFLQACPDLRRLALNHIWERGAYDTPRSVTLHSLRELELRGISSSHVLRWILAPQLQRLVVERRGLPRAWAHVEIGTHYATATDVTLIRFSAFPTALRNIVRAVPLVSSLKLVEFDFRSPDALSAEAVLQEQPLPCLARLHIQGTFSLFQLQKVVELHRATLSNVEVHCLDLGLPEESLAQEYQQRDEALKWLKEQSWFTFKANQDSGIIGDRYWNHQDQKWRRKMECGPNSRQYLL
ncbi:hypothetical protein FS837_011674 [Tulasnella sp. UAMH 9824]|nr:hypothetical protein FS837_011674 [Tulasnella sp. UAMH 9824]